jgi:cyanate permease
MLAAILGGATGPWVAGFSHDLIGSYSLAFWLSLACSALSALAIWRGAPGRRGGRID